MPEPHNLDLLFEKEAFLFRIQSLYPPVQNRRNEKRTVHVGQVRFS